MILPLAVPCGSGWNVTPMRYLWLVLLLGAARAEPLPGIAPEVPEAAGGERIPEVERQVRGDEAPTMVLIKQLKTIRLRGAEGSEWVEIGQGVEATGGLVLPSPRTMGARLERWIGKEMTDVALAVVLDEILIHYDGEGYPVVMVSVPQQDFTDGTLVVDVEPGRTGRVGVGRPKYGDAEVVAKGLRLREGQVLRRDDLEEQLAWFGRTGFRRPRLFVSPGLEPATADILIGLEERKPWQASVGYENSGTDLLGRDRLVFGASGMLPNEHVLAWRGVIGMPASSLVANAIRWDIPLHRSHQVIRLDAAYAEVESRYLFRGVPVETEGNSWSVSMMDVLSMPRVYGWDQSLAIGFEVKGTDQFLLFGGAPATPGPVTMITAAVDHGLSRKWDRGGMSVRSSLRISPGNLGGRNTDATFRAYDPAADSTYVFGNVSADGWWKPVGDWRLTGRLDLQAADSRLLPAEQMGAGGYRSVRGVDERAYSGDNGLFVSVEAQTPVIDVIPECRFRLLSFIDHAALEDRDGPSVSLSSVGVGVRARILDHVDLRFDHGWRLDDSENRSHIGIAFSF